MSLALTESEAVYTTPTQWGFGDNAMSLVVRTRGDAAALAPAIRQAIWSVDKNQAIVRRRRWMTCSRPRQRNGASR